MTAYLNYYTIVLPDEAITQASEGYWDDTLQMMGIQCSQLTF